MVLMRAAETAWARSEPDSNAALIERSRRRPDVFPEVFDH